MNTASRLIAALCWFLALSAQLSAQTGEGERGTRVLVVEEGVFPAKMLRSLLDGTLPARGHTLVFSANLSTRLHGDAADIVRQLSLEDGRTGARLPNSRALAGIARQARAHATAYIERERENAPGDVQKQELGRLQFVVMLRNYQFGPGGTNAAQAEACAAREIASQAGGVASAPELRIEPPRVYIDLGNDANLPLSYPRTIAAALGYLDDRSLPVNLFNPDCQGLGKDVSLEALDQAATCPASSDALRTDVPSDSEHIPLPACTIEPARMVLPTVVASEQSDSTPEIRGTWDHVTAVKLEVRLAGTTYAFGTDPALTASGPAWTLSVPQALRDDDYDVVVTTTDARGQTAADASSKDLRIDTTAPVAPTFDAPTRLPLTGTFASADTTRLEVSIAGRAYVLGQDGALGATGDRWSLSVALAPGTYELTAEAQDARRNTSSASGRLVLLPPLVVPSVTRLETAGTTPVVTGTWGNESGAQLTVTVNGAAYTPGPGQPLTVTGRDWSLAIPTALLEGVYDVAATVTDSRGIPASDATTDELRIVAAPPPAPKLQSPTVNPSAQADPTPTVTGTWGNEAGAVLGVGLGGTTYRAGSSPELVAVGETWSLTVPAPLPDGVHDVVATVTDGQGGAAADATTDELRIDTTPPGIPTVDRTSSMPATGSFDTAETRGLIVSVGNHAYTLGQDAALTASGNRWSLAGSLAPGTYDVAVEARDALGNVSRDGTSDELVIAPPVLLAADGEADWGPLTFVYRSAAHDPDPFIRLAAAIVERSPGSSVRLLTALTDGTGAVIPGSGLTQADLPITNMHRFDPTKSRNVVVEFDASPASCRPGAQVWAVVKLSGLWSDKAGASGTYKAGAVIASCARPLQIEIATFPQVE